MIHDRPITHSRVKRNHYITPIGHTAASLEQTPEKPTHKVVITEKKKKKKRLTFATKPPAIMAWYDELTSRKMQLLLHKAGKGDYTFEPWEYEYIPNMHKEAKRLIGGTKYLKLRIEASDKEIFLAELYKHKGIHPKLARDKELEEAEIVFWALEYFEKIYGGNK